MKNINYSNPGCYPSHSVLNSDIPNTSVSIVQLITRLFLNSIDILFKIFKHNKI